ncbi:hypothetical protein PSCICJ_14440 [Pseudomonas cichorii]|uniref:RNA-directed DNA polymerase n=1 Tax=Pseudomonas cichorii TaxID=36746 RepID=UPI00191107E3|nr:RNA-directed DNA polymerase [Pseudomonas cichorii]GFM65326.1 hypothetical protein PSCICJ_14440 [Pseudomonas cichorii]
MPYKTKFEGWEKLSIADLLIAYRKAKADCFFESGFPTAINFADYEQNLTENLESLLKKLKKDNGFQKNKELLGKFRLVPKKLSTSVKTKNGHIHFSNPDHAFEHLLKHYKITPELRIVGDFPVDTHIISALWINCIGHKFDQILDDSAYGARLKRVRDPETLANQEKKPFHITSIGSFERYFQPYQRWRNDGLAAIRRELDADQKIIAISLDLKSYYHQLDPSFLSLDSFHADIGLHESEETQLTESDKSFTKELSGFLSQWSQGAEKFSQEISNVKQKSNNGGLAIGLTASRVIANVLLKKWDTLIKEKITPAHYGRYIDDMFLVFHDPGNIDTPQSLMTFLQERLGKNRLFKSTTNKELWEINLDEKYQASSKIQLQESKQKMFILSGKSGCDLIDSIEKEINDLSSEHRLMPSPDQLEKTPAAKVLSAAGKVGEEADTLRRADGLTIRRLGWSLQLRHVETLARDLPKNEWRKERDEFYLFSHNHILRPDNIFAHYQYLPRLLGFAISLEDWEQAERIVTSAFAAFNKLEEKLKKPSKSVINGVKFQTKANLWKQIRGSLTWSFIDIAARSYPPHLIASEKRPNQRARKIAKIFVLKILDSLHTLEDILDLKFDFDDFHKKAPLLAISDLSLEPYKNLIKKFNITKTIKDKRKNQEKAVKEALNNSELIKIPDLEEFIEASASRRLSSFHDWKKITEPFFAYAFATRPYSPAEITEFIPACLGLERFSKQPPTLLWAKYARALRGVWVKPLLLEDKSKNKFTLEKKTTSQKSITIGGKPKTSVTVGITSIYTSDDEWAHTASGKSRLTLDRYKRISELVNQAIRLKPRPDYLIFPELSLPIQWIDSISNRLVSAGISLIAGTEYRHTSSSEIFSEAFLALTDERLGYRSSVRIWQPKLLPAVGEDKNLASLFGKNWKQYNDFKKPIYIHNDFHFGVLVCSELQNSRERVRLQGKVDSIFILSWNPDLDTFSSLIESSALDIHAYTILVNNRKYGDSRVRAPAKESFKRDIARLRGGENDFCVTVELDIKKLRAFQSRAKRWPTDNDPFKPVPEGFKISKTRKISPPK